ncbi:SMC5-SMC6 complex localization factor protein 1-like [Tubulanus polymorphus]|uniref:SMC5-SMC6 complex localization factor protein 1-like n=1 Tax=Tubulanus polymorphus TaxID=672921 RepID=UPI003DA332B5
MSKEQRNCGGAGGCGHGAGGCSLPSPYPSLVQTIDEMQFERGIWNAAIDGDVTRVEKFIRKGIHVDSEDTSGYTALHYASRHGMIEVCKVLLMNGAEVDARTRSGGVTSLQRAAYCGHVDIIRLLIAYKSNPLLQDNDGKTALHKAVERGRVDVARILVEQSPQLKLVKDKKGHRAESYVPDNCQSLLQICSISSSVNQE